ALGAVEDVVGREVDDRHAQRGDVPRPRDVDELRAGGVALGAVDVGPGGGGQHQRRVRRGRPRDGQLPPRARVRPPKGPPQRGAELAACARYEETASRSDRIGDLVLQRSTTRGSFHGTPCSSGSAGSYSSVTW